MNGLNKFRGRPFNYITPFNIRLFSESKTEQPKKDKAVIMKEYEELFNYMKENSVWKEIGKTEIVKNDLNPTFQTSF